ncbi:unnamed protein product, partial [marine sediment metagenome]
IPAKYVYFVHSIFSDIKKKKFYIDIHPFAIISKDSFTRDMLYVNWTFPSLEGYMNHSINEIDKLKYRIKSDYFNLVLNSKKKPFLEGKRGFLNFGSKSTYYYSITNMDTGGYVVVGKKRINVKGKSWMDHQWANVSYTPNNQWSWFGIQLDNDVEMVVFKLVVNNKKFYFGSVMDENGESYKTTKVKINSLKDKFQSKKTGAVYPVSWRIRIPSKKIDLIVKPLIKNQEVIFGAINYLENP